MKRSLALNKSWAAVHGQNKKVITDNSSLLKKKVVVTAKVIMILIVLVLFHFFNTLLFTRQNRQQPLKTHEKVQNDKEAAAWRFAKQHK